MAISSLLLVGCGKMGGALLERWRQHNPSGIKEFFVIDPQAGKGYPDLASLPPSSRPETEYLSLERPAEWSKHLSAAILRGKG